VAVTGVADGLPVPEDEAGEVEEGKGSEGGGAAGVPSPGVILPSMPGCIVEAPIIGLNPVTFRVVKAVAVGWVEAGRSGA